MSGVDAFLWFLMWYIVGFSVGAGICACVWFIWRRRSDRRDSPYGVDGCFGVCAAAGRERDPSWWEPPVRAPHITDWKAPR